MRKRLTIVAGVVAVLSLIGAMAFVQFAKADDLLRTDVGRRDVPVYKNGSSSAGAMTVRAYASQFDADGDGDTIVDSQRAVGRVYKHNGVRRIQINTVRLQRYTSTGWETLRSSGTVNTGTAQSAVAYTAPPTPFKCNGSTIYRVQVIGLVRWNDNSLNSFNVESGHWVNVPLSSGACEPVNV